MEDGPAPTRTFFTSSVFVSEYLRCVLQAEDLAALGVHSIYHGLERKDYQKMLGGIPCFPRVARPRRGALLPDVELDPVMALAGDANQAGDDGGQEDNADAVPAGAAWDGDDEEFVDLEVALEELLAEEAAGADEALGGAGLVALGGEGLETLGAGPGTPPACLDAAPLPPVPPPPHDPDDDRGARRGRGDPCGCFAIIFKVRVGKHGAYQATCPFHRGIDTAIQWKKTLSVPGPGPDAADNAVKLLKAPTQLTTL